MNDPTKVTTRILDWAELVKKAWGPEWNEPDIAYRFGNERTFKSSDGNQGGIYEECLPEVGED